MIDNDMAAMMVADAERAVENVDNEKLSLLSKLIADMKSEDAQIANLEESLKEHKDRRREITEKRIPDLFDEMGVSELKMADGSKVSIQREYAATITAANRDTCFKWLIENGHGAVIKHDLTVKLKKGEENEKDEILKVLAEQGVTYQDKKSVHPQTLKSLVREQIEKGVDFPQKDFKVFPLRFTKIK